MLLLILLSYQRFLFTDCFGVDFSTTNMKIKIGEDRYITSNMTALATISNIKADPSTRNYFNKHRQSIPCTWPINIEDSSNL